MSRICSIKWSKSDYQEQLFKSIITYGYWSKEVKSINDVAVEQFPYDKYLKYQSEVREEIRTKYNL